MLILKRPLQNWTADKINKGDYEIMNESKQNVCDIYSNEIMAGDPNKFPTVEEAEFNALLIKKAPAMAQALIDLHSQFKDSGKMNIHALGIEAVLKGLTVER